MKKILLLIVNYNLEIQSSKTIESLKKIDFDMLNFEYDTFIWDNIPRKNNGIIRKNILEYYPSNENVPLSKIYNFAIKKFKNTHNYIIILDNDSCIKREYFFELEKTILENQKISLILPIVKSNHKIVSPAKLYFIKGKYFKKIKPGVAKSKNLSAINSGMAISMEYLKKSSFKYDEDLRFYGTDTYFMKKYQKIEDKLFILNFVLEHSLSAHNIENVEKKLFRYNDFKNGMKVIYKNNVFKLFLVIVYLKLLDIKMFIKNKNIRFLRGE